MKILKPLQLSFRHKVFQVKGKHKLAVSLLLGFSFERKDALLESELWKFIAAELGKDGILDIWMPKPNGEVLIYGKCFAANAIPVKSERVRMRVGHLDKTLLVYGNRYWGILGPSNPEPFVEMPLDYAHAFGGEGFAKNPTGKGMGWVELPGEKRRPLPNIECANLVMTSPDQRPDPAGFGPFDMTWEFRASKLGTYNDKWLKERWPAYPDDLDWSHFNAAPPDQWLPGFFGGGESFELVNMHPEKAVLKGQLPAFRTRCFIQRNHSAADDVEEVDLRAETVWLFPRAEKGILLWRGVIDIETDDARDLRNVIMGYENLEDVAREKSHYVAALLGRLGPDRAHEYEFNTTDLIPDGARCGYGAIKVDTPEQPLDSGFPTESEGSWSLPPFFPRPPGHELIDEFRAAEEHAERLREAVRQRGGDENMVPAPFFDIEALSSKLEHAAREMKEGYRAQAHLLEKGRPTHWEDVEMVRQELLERLANKQPVRGWDVAGIDLSNQELSGADLAGCYLEGVDLSGSNLRGANLEGAILAFAELTRCDLSGANLKNANLGSADLSQAVCDGADLTDAILARSVLRAAKLTHCNMTGTDLMETRMENCDLSGSFLAEAQFFELYMAGSKFQKTNLARSTFTKCNVEGCDYSEATLDGSTWIESTLNGAIFTRARMTNTRFPGGTSLLSAKFQGAILDTSNFRKADLRAADFTDASINMCDFGGANAKDALFNRSCAKRAKFIGTDLGGADLSSMNLMDGTLMKARLTSAKLCNANCYGVEFMNATVGGTDFSGAILEKTKLEQWRPG